MGKYFEFYNTTENPELTFIRGCLGKLGKLRITDGELQAFWSTFSEEYYAEGFVVPEEHIVKEFADWLVKSKYN